MADFVPWVAVSFGTKEARDQFLQVIATHQGTEVEVRAMFGVTKGAWVRWRPGRFLSLNDIAYAHGGRIAVSRWFRDKGSGGE
jgi:hypothetical protein